MLSFCKGHHYVILKLEKILGEFKFVIEFFFRLKHPTSMFKSILGF